MFVALLVNPARNLVVTEDIKTILSGNTLHRARNYRIDGAGSQQVVAQGNDPLTTILQQVVRYKTNQLAALIEIFQHIPDMGHIGKFVIRCGNGGIGDNQVEQVAKRVVHEITSPDVDAVLHAEIVVQVNQVEGMLLDSYHSLVDSLLGDTMP